MSAAQQTAVEELLPCYGLRYATTPLDFTAVFGRRAPVVLEIGSGMGDTTAEIAATRPEADFVAIEVHGPGVGSLLRHVVQRRLTNLRIIRHDAVEVVEHMIAADSLAGIHVYFPDPWPKKRHHKRRLMKAKFVHLLASRLASGGYLHAATDWEDYAWEMLSTLSAEPLLTNSTTGFAPRPPWRPRTKFEKRGLQLGHEVFDLVFHRRD